MKDMYAINRLSTIWKSDSSDKIKRVFFQVVAASVLLYSCTTWTFTKHQEKNPEAITHKTTDTYLPSYKPSKTNQTYCCRVDRVCRIHRLLLCRGVRLPPNMCPGYDTKKSDREIPVSFGNAEHLFIAIIPWSSLAQSGRTW